MFKVKSTNMQNTYIPLIVICFALQWLGFKDIESFLIPQWLQCKI